jgi:hypothetical protein
MFRVDGKKQDSVRKTIKWYPEWFTLAHKNEKEKKKLSQANKFGTGVICVD